MSQFELTPEQRELQGTARRFRREVIDPIEPHRREWADAAERFPWEVIEEGSRWGLRTLTAPREYGGREAGVLDLCLVVEELAAGDMGVAVAFDQTWKVCAQIADLATDEQREWFFPPFVEDHRYLLAIGVAEPEHATDVHLSRYLARLHDVRVSLTTTAVPDGDEWVVNGHKLMPSCASTAKLVVVMAQTEPDAAIHDGCTYFLVPAGTPGLRVSTVWEKISQRLVDNAGLVFEDLRVPAARLLGRRGAARTHPTTSGGNIEAGATTLGSARGAYEAALGWARQRVQGGRPLLEQQAVGMMLAEMAVELEAARSLVWRAAAAFDAGDRRTPLQYAAKWHAAEVAVRVCVKAMEVVGGKAVLLEMPVQKYLRDCLSFLHSDGTQQSRLMMVQQRLLDDPSPDLSVPVDLRP